MTHWFRRSWRFQSTLPARGATVHEGAHVPRVGDFNPRSPHGERQGKRSFSVQAEYFNPRSPHGERRRRTRPEGFCPRISIHAPRTGSDESPTYSVDSPPTFQSTLPARGATLLQDADGNPGRISIHAPRTGSDHVMDPEQTVQRHFNPRSPHGERRCAADGSFLAE